MAPTYPTIDLTGLPIRVSYLDPPTKVQTSLTGKETRIAYGTQTRRVFEIPLELLSVSERTSFRTFIQDCSAGESFSITDPESGSSVTVRLDDPGALTRLYSTGWGSGIVRLVQVI